MRCTIWDLALLGAMVVTVSLVTQSVIMYLIITHLYDSNLKVSPWAPSLRTTKMGKKITQQIQTNNAYIMGHTLATYIKPLCAKYT